ncbi:MAG: hypothetical protein ACXAE3_00455 [Candidatus Kariarchaeaceae archaeon]|jgi:hypothetical protein
MSDTQLIFDLTEGMKTSDNYFIKLKGFVRTSEVVNEQHLLSSVTAACRDHVSRISLMDALDLVKAEQSAPIGKNVEDFSELITTFEVSTVDAVEIPATSTIEVDINPDLENQSQSKGFIGKIKSIFRR